MGGHIVGCQRRLLHLNACTWTAHEWTKLREVHQVSQRYFLLEEGRLQRDKSSYGHREDFDTPFLLFKYKTLLLYIPENDKCKTA